MRDSRPFLREAPEGVGGLKDVLLPSGWDAPEGMFAGEFSGSDRFNLLLLGNTEQNLTDMMMVVSVGRGGDGEAGAVSIISIPRDTFYDVPYVPAPGKKIHANYLLGGPGQAAVAVHDVLLGLPIHAYAVVGYEGVAAVVDAVGGVEADVPFDMDQDEEAQGYHVHLAAGEQVLDGEQAVAFLRFRRDYADADLGRQRAQREFLAALLARVSSPVRLAAAMRAAAGHLDSDLTVGEAVFLARALGGGGAFGN